MRISFKNFKSYSSLTDINVNKFNVVLGRNNSGKSTLSEAIAYFNSIFLDSGKFLYGSDDLPSFYYTLSSYKQTYGEEFYKNTLVANGYARFNRSPFYVPTRIDRMTVGHREPAEPAPDREFKFRYNLSDLNNNLDIDNHESLEFATKIYIGSNFDLGDTVLHPDKKPFLNPNGENILNEYDEDIKLYLLEQQIHEQQNQIDKLNDLVDDFIKKEEETFIFEQEKNIKYFNESLKLDEKVILNKINKLRRTKDQKLKKQLYEELNSLSEKEDRFIKDNEKRKQEFLDKLKISKEANILERVKPEEKRFEDLITEREELVTAQEANKGIANKNDNESPILIPLDQSRNHLNTNKYINEFSQELHDLFHEASEKALSEDINLKINNSDHFSSFRMNSSALKVLDGLNILIQKNPGLKILNSEFNYHNSIVSFEDSSFMYKRIDKIVDDLKFEMFDAAKNDTYCFQSYKHLRFSEYIKTSYHRSVHFDESLVDGVSTDFFKRIIPKYPRFGHSHFNKKREDVYDQKTNKRFLAENSFAQLSFNSPNYYEYSPYFFPNEFYNNPRKPNLFVNDFQTSIKARDVYKNKDFSTDSVNAKIDGHNLNFDNYLEIDWIETVCKELNLNYMKFFRKIITTEKNQKLKIKHEVIGAELDPVEVDALKRYQHNPFSEHLSLSLYIHFFRKFTSHFEDKNPNPIIGDNRFNQKLDYDLVRKFKKKHGFQRLSDVKDMMNDLHILFVSLIVEEFELNIRKYLMSNYVNLLNGLNFRFKGFDKKSQIITPSIISKDDNIITNEKMIELFGNHFNSIIENIPKQARKIAIPNNLKKFVKYINNSLRSCKQDIKISIKPITYRETQSSEIFLNSFKVKIYDNKKWIDMSETGTGNGALVGIIGKLYLIVNENKNIISDYNICTLKEPENFLHPSLCADLIEFLFNEIFKKDKNNNINNKNSSLIIETHSEVVLRKFQSLVKNYDIPESAFTNFDMNKLATDQSGELEEDVKTGYFNVLYVDKDETSSKIIDLEIQPNGFLKTNIPSGFYDINTDLINELWDINDDSK